MTLTDQQIIARVIDGMKLSREQGCKLEIYNSPDQDGFANEFCFFPKPTVAEKLSAGDFHPILELFLKTFKKFDLSVDEIHALPAQYLQQYNIMDKHYGVLEGFARRPLKHLTDQIRHRFREAYNVEMNSVDVLGGFEFIDRYRDMSASALDVVWSNVEHERLASGCFCGKIKVGNEVTYVINGFTPRQLSTYTDNDIVIVVFKLSGNASWSYIRTNFLGKPDPAAAVPGSIRHELFANRNHFGLREVSLARNGAHLSAGPIEALIELKRCLSNFANNNLRPIEAFQFGRKLISNFSPEEIAVILDNVTVEYEANKCSLYDLTEGMDESKTIELLSDLRVQFKPFIKTKYVSRK